MSFLLEIGCGKMKTDYAFLPTCIARAGLLLSALGSDDQVHYRKAGKGHTSVCFTRASHYTNATLPLTSFDHMPVLPFISSGYHKAVSLP